MRISKKLIDITGMRDIAQRRILVVSADSKTPGPVVWLTACIHGDEVGGIAVVHDVFAALRRVGLQRGAVYALPLINSMGFENVSRFFNSDREDLNRCFPGRVEGTMGQQVAHRLFNMITRSAPQLVIDIHNDWIRSIPYVLLEPDAFYASTALQERTADFAVDTGLLLVEDSDVFDASHNTLAGALVDFGIAAFTIESGGARTVAEEGVTATRDAILSVLASLQMIDKPASGAVGRRARPAFRYTNKPLCTKNGLIRFSAQPGEAVETGQVLARVYSPFGSCEETLTAVAPGIVLGFEDHARALPGREFVAIAERI